jgi:hypothetical protein
MAKISERILSTMLRIGDVQYRIALTRAKRALHKPNVGETVDSDIVRKPCKFSGAGLYGNYQTARADAPSCERRIKALVRTDINEYSILQESLLQERELVRLKAAANVQTPALVVAKHKVKLQCLYPKYPDRLLNP